MTALVTENMALMAAAPGGISGLRQLILQLAVRGALLAQDPTDVPAGRELSMLATERSKAATKKTRGAKVGARTAIKQPHSIPTSWQWCTLAEVVEVLNGRAYKKEELLEAGTPVLRVGNLFTSNHWYYSNLSLGDDKCCESGDLIFAWSASFGPFIWTGERVIYHYHIWKLKPHDEAAVSKRYLNLYLQERTQAIKAAGHGVSMAHMTKEKMEVLPVALPPLAEQHRIVAKVDELMALCDRLEARQQDAEAAHARLVQVLLDSLTQARDADEFQACWQRLAHLFPEALASETAVERLRRVVQQLGVMGRLTSRELNDGSGADLLSKISATRSTSSAAVRSRGTTGMVARKVPYELPSDWCWSTAEQVCEVIVDCPHSTPKFVPSGVLCLDTNSVKQGQIVPERSRYVDESTYVDRVARLVPQAGDVVFAREGSVGESVVIPVGLHCCLGQRVMLFRPCLVEPAYLQLALSEPSAVSRQLAIHKGIGAKHVNVADMRMAWVPLPPLAEQHRIVFKVTELLALCDHLKARIAAALAKQAQIAEALVADALAA
jgi:type I restriction enzyme S subunit